MNTKTISVLIVDDHSVVRLGMAALLNAETGIKVVGNAKNGIEAVSMAQTLRPDVIVMDIEMPRKDGIEATADILAEDPDAKILILTSFSTPAGIPSITPPTAGPCDSPNEVRLKMLPILFFNVISLKSIEGYNVS